MHVHISNIRRELRRSPKSSSMVSLKLLGGVGGNSDSGRKNKCDVISSSNDGGQWLYSDIIFAQRYYPHTWHFSLPTSNILVLCYSRYYIYFRVSNLPYKGCWVWSDVGWPNARPITNLSLVLAKKSVDTYGGHSEHTYGNKRPKMKLSQKLKTIDIVSLSHFLKIYR